MERFPTYFQLITINRIDVGLTLRARTKKQVVLKEMKDKNNGNIKSQFYIYQSS